MTKPDLIPPMARGLGEPFLSPPPKPLPCTIIIHGCFFAVGWAYECRPLADDLYASHHRQLIERHRDNTFKMIDSPGIA